MKKRFSAIAVLILLLIGTFLTMTACNDKDDKGKPGDSDKKDITIANGDMPQTIFVLGNELDLSKGKITVDGETIPMNSDKIKVDGYNKDTLGEQKLTLTYKDKTVELTVTVVPRVQTAESYLYFIGDAMNVVNMRFKITRDDGTDFTVKAGDEGLTISNFDTTVAHDTLQLGISYDKNGEKFTGSVNISVVSPEVSLKKPRKLEYGNHETELDLAGLTLTLKNADGKTTREIETSKLQLTGFDPSAVNADNATATQTIKVTYNGREMGSFDITVKYSNVSLVRDASTALSVINWAKYEYPPEGSNTWYSPVELTDALGEKAIDAIKAYNALPAAEKKLIAKSDLENVVRPALVYGYRLWQGAVDRAYPDVFTVYFETIKFVCATPEDAKAGYDRLTSKTPDEDTQFIMDMGNLLTSEVFKTTCKDVVLYNGAEVEKDGKIVPVDLTVGAIAETVQGSSGLKSISNVLSRMENINNTVKKIPAGWTPELLQSTYGSDIESLYSQLTAIDGSTVAENFDFTILQNWRSDFYEIMYRYYYAAIVKYMEGETPDTEKATEVAKKLSGLMNMYIPEPLKKAGVQIQTANEVRTAFVDMIQMVQQEMIEINGDTMAAISQYYLAESTVFIMEYRKAVEAANELLSLNDEMYTFLYEMVLSSTMEEMTYGDLGYATLMAATAYDSELGALWEKYIRFCELLGQDPEAEDFEAFDQAALTEELLTMFTSMRPVQQLEFINAMNYMYSLDIPTFALAPDEYGLVYSTFTDALYTYIYDMFGGETKEEQKGYFLFMNLMMAAEGYANHSVEFFCNIMDETIAEYNSTWVDGARKELFDAKFGSLYEKYVELRGLYEKTEVKDEEGNVTGEEYTYKEIDLGEYQAIFDELSLQLTRLSIIQFYIEGFSVPGFPDMSIEGGDPIYTVALATCERILQLSNMILASDNPDVIHAYYNMGMESGMTMYEGVYDMRSYMMECVYTLGLDWNEYEKMTTLRSFLASASEYLMTTAVKYEEVDETGQKMSFQLIQSMGTDFKLNFTFTPENVVTMMENFRKMSDTEKAVFVLLDTMCSNLYFGGMFAWCNEIFADSVTLQGMALSLNMIEQYSITYKIAPDYEETMEDGTTMKVDQILIQLYDELKGMYDELAVAEDQTDFNTFNSFFADMYAYYAEFCSGLKTAE